MRSPDSSTEQDRGGTDWPQQDEESSRHPANHAGVLAPDTDDYQDVDDIEADDELTHARVAPLGAGMLVAAARHNAQGTTTSYNFDGNHSSYQIPVALPHQSHRSPSPDYYDEDDDEDMTEIEGGVPLEQVSPAAHNEAYTGSHPFATGVDHNYTDSDDDDDDDDYNIDLAQDSDDDELSAAQPFDPYLNFNGPPNFPLHLHTLYGGASMMGTQLPYEAWVGANHGILPVPEVDMAAFENAVDTLPPVQTSNPNPTIPGAENLGLVDFLRHWAYQGSFTDSPRTRPPGLREVIKQATASVKDVKYSDLDGDECDFQGLNWTTMETTRNAARARRCRTYKNYVNHEGSDVLAVCHPPILMKIIPPPHIPSQRLFANLYL